MGFKMPSTLLSPFLPTFIFFFGCTALHMGSYFPDQGSNPCPLQWKLGGLITGLPGNSPFLPTLWSMLFLTIAGRVTIPSYLASILLIYFIYLFIYLWLR